ncbi:hypothetical protein GIB67_038354 [Kingdonia uniflora]|uniref:Squalene cyclase N-terminal domain-containing protein n=1 Tax=Kingdonia uniflora TaxID=39325 RepID=A0A7J7KW90_9MAGN|nr:hypothetical protein GIB67_038354 [Kingdonia uniflora]
MLQNAGLHLIHYEDARHNVFTRTLERDSSLHNKDGGWGFHIVGHSTMFGTTLNYICMRLLGEGPEGGEDNACVRARNWIRDHGGVTSIPSWGKTWLLILGLFEWSGCNPMPPEFWLLPFFIPIHPAKMWKEVHIEPYNEIQQFKYHHVCAKCFNVEGSLLPPPPHPLIQNLIWDYLNMFAEPVLTRWPLSKLRDKALKITMKHFHYNDENSRYFTLGCVEKKSDAFKKHLARVPDYLWMAEDVMRVQSLGSQMWNTGFSVHALLASNFQEEITHMLKKGYDFIKQSQIYASKLNSEHTRYNKERATEKHNKLEEIIMKPEQKGQQKIRYAFSDKETPLENAHGYDLKPSSEDHVSHEDLTRLVRMVWTMLIVVKMMKWLIGRPFLT